MDLTETSDGTAAGTQRTADLPHAAGAPSSLSPVVKWLAIAEFVFGVGALAVLGETNPLYYVLVVAVGVVIVALVAYDQRHRERTEKQSATRRAEVRRAADEVMARAIGTEEPPVAAGAAPDHTSADTADHALPVESPPRAELAPTDPLRPPVDQDDAAPDGSAPPAGPSSRPASLRSTREEFVAALVEYGMRTGVRTITRADREGWAEALRVEYDLLLAAACCAENERAVVGELVMWDSVSVLHLLDTPKGLGNGISRSVVAPYGRLPAATRVPVRRDPARFTCEVATLALDPLVADEYALNLLWRGIYDHARRGGATEVVWTLAADLATLWRERFGFPLEVLGDSRRAASGTTVTVMIPLPELEARLLRERPAYYGWLTVGFADAERAALGLPVDLSGAYDRVCGFVMARLDEVRSPLALR